MEGVGEPRVTRRDLFKKILPKKPAPATPNSETKKTDLGETARPSRRTVLKGAVALGASIALSQALGPGVAHIEPRAKEAESRFRGEASFGAIKGLNRRSAKDKNNYEQERAIHALDSIVELFKNNHADVVLTPEFSFNVPGHPLVLKKRGDEYDVDPATDPLQKDIIEKLKALAVANKANIFAATFNEKVEGHKGEDNTLLHINSEGAIVGLKRKTFPPEGDFFVRRGEKQYKVLPIICGEMWLGAVLNEEKTFSPENTEGENVYDKVIPEWIKQGAPYDILLHPQWQADVDFGQLASVVQEDPSTTSVPAEVIGQRKDAFRTYYYEYFPYLKEGAPIVTGDMGIAAVLGSDLKPMKDYNDTQAYSQAKISR